MARCYLGKIGQRGEVPDFGVRSGRTRAARVFKSAVNTDVEEDDNCLDILKHHGIDENYSDLGISVNRKELASGIRFRSPQEKRKLRRCVLQHRQNPEMGQQ